MLKILQSRGNGVRRGSNSQFPAHTRTLKANDLGFGSLLFITKSAPSPRFRMNTYAKVNWDTGKIDDSALTKTLVKLDNKLRGKIDSNVNITYMDCDEIDQA